MHMLKKNSRVFVAGHNGLVGKAVHALLIKREYKNILFKRKSELNLTNKEQVNTFFKKHKPEFLIMCAARVGGIIANRDNPLEFLLENLAIEKNLLLAAKKYKIKRTIFLGSSCVYPKKSKIPIKESYLMTGKLEETNEAYALAKIVGIKLCSILHNKYKQDIVCLMPTNLYGENDNFDISSGHVIPGLISKFITAKKYKKIVKIWGSGKPIREFIHVDDLAEAVFTVLNTKNSHFKKIMNDKMPILNIGSGESLSIKKLAYLIKKLVDFKGKIIFDKSYPDGTFKKNLNSKRIKSLNWGPKIKLSKGLKKIIDQRNTY
jgi:GDP-L-fucose synthase